MKLIKRCLLGDSIKRKYLDEAMSFAKDYRNSPGFKERWNKIGNKGVTRRLGSKYDPSEGYGKVLWSLSNWTTSNKINSWNNSSNAAYFPSQGFYIGTNKNPVSAMSNWKDLLTHEVGHYFEANMLPTYIDSYTKEKQPMGTYFSDLYPIFRKSKSYNDSLDLISNDEDIKKYERDPSYTYYDLYLGGYLDKLSDSLHDGTPTESYADLFLLKKKLLNLGIYDVRKANNPFTKQHLDQFKKKNKDKVRLLDNFSDADVIWMMNNVAQNNTPVKNKYVDYAKYGSKFKKLQIGGYVQPSNVLKAINNGSAALGVLEGFGRVMNKILPKWMLKAGTYVSPLNYAAALSKGSINPKVGEEVVSKWHPNILLTARLGEAVFGGKAIKNTPKAIVNTAAKAGNKTARAHLISKELNNTIKKGLKPTPLKTDKEPYGMDDLISNYNGGKQNLESWWLDRELNTGDPNKLVHFDNGDFKPHFYKNGIHLDKIKGAYIKDGKLVPSEEGELLRLWWSPGKPFLNSHFTHEQSSYWGLPKRYITVDRNVSDFELMYYSDPVTMRPMPADEIVSNGPVDLSNASIIQKSPFGWWERVKSYKSSSDWTLNLPGKRDYSMSRKPSYSGYTPTKLNPTQSKFVRDVMQGYKWGMNKKIKPAGNKDFTEELKGKERLGYGAESNVYEDVSNPNQVLKTPSDGNGLVTPHSTLKGAIREGLFIATPFNRLPYNLPLNVEGAVRTSEGKYIPVFSLRKVYIPLMDKPKIIDFDKSVNGMYSAAKPDINNILLENDIQRARDFKLPNIGFLSDGTVMGIDLWRKGGKLWNLKRN